jgi:YHS domain-containing protein
MEVDPQHAAARMEHHRTTYFFCSRDDHERFMADPERYAQKVRTS